MVLCFIHLFNFKSSVIESGNYLEGNSETDWFHIPSQGILSYSNEAPVVMQNSTQYKGMSDESDSHCFWDLGHWL